MSNVKSPQKRTLISETVNCINQIVLIKGWVRIRRDHGKLIFLDVRDRAGVAQVVVNPKVSKKAYDVAQELKPEFVVEILGKVNKRPEGTINKDLPTGNIELEAQDIGILSKSETLPFDTGGEALNLELPTLLDHRALTLRHPKVSAIFKIQNTIVDAFRRFMQQNDFFEFQSPLISQLRQKADQRFLKYRILEVKPFLHKVLSYTNRFWLAHSNEYLLLRKFSAQSHLLQLDT
jgi:aspartyl-tRNA synthetase